MTDSDTRLEVYVALNGALELLRAQTNEDGVRAFLRRFAATYFAPLKQAFRERSLSTVRRYVEELHALEGGDVRCDLSPAELVAFVEQWPAVQYLRTRGVPVSPLFPEIIRVVNEAICEDTPFRAELVFYDEETGRNVQRFILREAL